MPLIFVFLALSASAITLPYFTPGAYDLEQGTVETCGQGPFEYLQNGTYVGFGAFHLFPLENKSEKMNSELPEFAGCVYEGTSRRASEKKTSTLNFEETLKCGETIRHVLTKTAVVNRTSVTLDVAQKGNAAFGDQEPSYGFRCIWKLKGAARRGGASTSKK